MAQGASAGYYSTGANTQFSADYPPPDDWTQEGATNFATCRKSGFKNVQALRVWHGTFPLNDANHCKDSGGLCGDGSCKVWTSYQEFPTRTKYLTWDYSATYTSSGTFGIPCEIGSGTYQIARKYSVNPLTGEKTMVSGSESCTSFGAWSTDPDCSNPGNDPCLGTQEVPPAGEWWWCRLSNCMQYEMFGNVDFDCGLCNLLSNYLQGRGIIHTPLTSRLCIPASATASDGGTWTWDGSNGSLSGGTSGYTESLALVFTGTSASITITGATDKVNHSVEISASLSDPIIDSAVYADACDNLLSTWPLNDDALYPWRFDPYLAFAPLVSRREYPSGKSPVGIEPLTLNDLRNPINDSGSRAPFSPGWIPTYDQMSWVDMSCYEWRFAEGTNAGNSAAVSLDLIYDGAILGAPKPAGYSGYFDFQHENISGQPTYDSGSGAINGFSFDTDSYGAKNYGSIYGLGYPGALPLNATQWTNTSETIMLPPGAFIFYSDQQLTGNCSINYTPGDTQILRIGKYAEIKEVWRSQIFARPAGADRFLYDEDFVYAVYNMSGSGVGATFKLLDYLGNTVILADTSGVWGGSSVGGFYSITQAGDGTVTLGTKQFDTPAGWTSRSGDASVCFGKLRWPTAPGILGRYEVAVTDNGDGTCNLNSPNGFQYCITTDAVNLYKKGMALASANLSITKMDDSNAKVTATFSDVADSVWITPYKLFDGTTNGGQYQYADEYPKGDYAMLQWLLDNRTNGEYTRLTGVTDCSDVQVLRPTQNFGYAYFSQTADCLPFNSCQPMVICSSPNQSDLFPNGKTYLFPGIGKTVSDDRLIENALGVPEFDEQYGTNWYSLPITVMTDLFWQTPHHPLTEASGLFEDTIPTYNIRWVEDGSEYHDIDALPNTPIQPAFQFCNPDRTVVRSDLSEISVQYFAHEKLVECRLTVPAGFPSLPAGIQLGWLSPVDHDSGDVSYHPAPLLFECSDGSQRPYNAPWVLHKRFCDATADDSDCRFKTEYEETAIGCATETTEPTITLGANLIPVGAQYDVDTGNYTLSGLTIGTIYRFTKNTNDLSFTNGSITVNSSVSFVARNTSIVLAIDWTHAVSLDVTALVQELIYA